MRNYEIDLDQIHDRCIDIPNREIYLHGIEMVLESADEAGYEPGVEYMMAVRFIKNLHILKDISEDPILVHMHTCGGNWSDGMAIYDAIKSMPYHVTIVSYTHARSMSSLILQAGDSRVLMPNSYFLIHWGESGFEGTAPQMVANAKHDEIIMGKMLDVYTESSNVPRTKIKNMMDKRGDWIMMPDEAIDSGFADKIFTDWKEI